MIYERGEFTAESTALTSAALIYYAIGMIGYGLMEFLNKAFYAMQDSKTPMKTSVVAIILNVVLSIVLVRTMGYVGLPLATSITSIVTALLMLALANKKIKGIVNKETLKESLKTVIAATVMALVILVLKKVIVGETILYTLIRVGVSVLAGIIIYFASVILVKDKTRVEFITKIKYKAR